MKNVIILRGTPSSGKDTVASLFQGYTVVSADHFMTEYGKYVFNPNKLGFCHKQCKIDFDEALKAGKNIVVANTNCRESEFSYYRDEAEKHGYMVFFLVVEKRHKNFNDHNVPSEKIEQMAETIKKTLKLS